MNEKLLNLIAETAKRWGAESPQFFKIVQYISITIAVFMGLPAYLQEMGVELPAAWDFFVDKAMFYLALGATLVSKLTVKDPESLK